MKIPFIDLNIQYKALSKEIDSAIRSVIKDSAYLRESTLLILSRNIQGHMSWQSAQVARIIK